MPSPDAVDRAVGQIAAATRGAGKHLSLQFQGFNDVDDQLERLFARGANMITIPLLGLLLRESELLAGKIRSAKRG